MPPPLLPDKLWVLCPPPLMHIWGGIAPPLYSTEEGWVHPPIQCTNYIHMLYIWGGITPPPLYSTEEGVGTPPLNVQTVPWVHFPHCGPFCIDMNTYIYIYIYVSNKERNVNHVVCIVQLLLRAGEFWLYQPCVFPFSYLFSSYSICRLSTSTLMAIQADPANTVCLSLQADQATTTEGRAWPSH